MYFAIKIYIAQKKLDLTVLKAKAFLSESFLKNCWTLILLMCLFFIIHAAAEMIEIAGLFTETDLMLMKEGTELGILICTVILGYKWSNLTSPAKP